tara:strand:+ start:351 stop:470 length:120 start_codon:yes stop_codon:yes gene_type:complete
MEETSGDSWLEANLENGEYASGFWVSMLAAVLLVPACHS